MPSAAEKFLPRIRKRRLEHWTEEGFCELCGNPVIYPEDPAWEIEGREEFLFCSKHCAKEWPVFVARENVNERERKEAKEACHAWTI